MQAMPMINLPAPVNEAVAARAARTTGKGTDDKFLPALREACNDCGDDELAGAAMVSQEGRLPQPLQPVSTDAVQEQPVAQGKSPLVTTDELLTATTANSEPVISSSGPVIDGDELAALPAAKVVTVAAEVENSVAEVITPTIAKDNAVVANTIQPLKNEVTEQRTEFARSVQEGRHQQNFDRSVVTETRTDSVSNGVSSAATQVGEAQKGITAQVVAAVSEGNPVQQLNIQPLKKVTEVAVNVEKMGTEQVAGNRPVVTDPRFASLLNKPEVGATLRQQQGLDSSVATPAAAVMADSGSQVVSEVANTLGGKGDVALAPVADPLAGPESIGAPLATAQQSDGTISSAVHPQVVAGEVTTLQSSEASIPLKNGTTMPESRVVQQTIDHLTLHARGDSSTVTVRLHPEELGELQLRMVMEGDQLKVHLHAQTQQVQEVLERNFPRLRDALQDQGVTVEDFQVSVDSGERGDQQPSEQREFVANRQSDHFSSYDHDSDAEVEAVIPAAAAQAGGRGVSLRV